MIPVSLATALLVPFLFTMVLLLGIWLFYDLRTLRRPLITNKERIYRCSVCNHVYVDGRDVPLVRCPRCGCLNDPILKEQIRRDNPHDKQQ